MDQAEARAKTAEEEDVLLQERLEEVVNNLSGNNREVCNIDRSDRCQYQIQIKEKSVKNLLVDAWEIL